MSHARLTLGLSFVTICALACSKEPAASFTVLTLPSGHAFKVHDRSKKSVKDGTVLQVSYLGDSDQPKRLVDEAQELFDSVSAEAEASKYKAVIIESDVVKHRFFGLVTWHKTFNVVFQKNAAGKWTHTRPS